MPWLFPGTQRTGTKRKKKKKFPLSTSRPWLLQAKEKAAQRKQAKGSEGWFDLKKNTSVYVTGLPEDVSVQEMVEVFSKCGIIKEDDQVCSCACPVGWLAFPACSGIQGMLELQGFSEKGSRGGSHAPRAGVAPPRAHASSPGGAPGGPRPCTQRHPRIKIYRDEAGVPKGDGLVTFLKEPSVELAIQLLDGAPFRYGVDVRGQRGGGPGGVGTPMPMPSIKPQPLPRCMPACMHA